MASLPDKPRAYEERSFLLLSWEKSRHIPVKVSLLARDQRSTQVQVDAAIPFLCLCKSRQTCAALPPLFTCRSTSGTPVPAGEPGGEIRVAGGRAETQGTGRGRDLWDPMGGIWEATVFQPPDMLPQNHGRPC